MLNYGKLDKYPDRRTINTPQTVPGAAVHNVQGGLIEVYDEEEFNYNFDEKDQSVVGKSEVVSRRSEVGASEKKDAKELSLLHAQVENDAGSKKSSLMQQLKEEPISAVRQPTAKSGGILDSEEPSENYVTVNAYGEEAKRSNSNNLNDSSMFNKTGPAPSQSSLLAEKQAKAAQVATMKNAVKDFLGNMVSNEKLYQRFKKMEEDDESEMKELVQEEFKMLEAKESRAAKMSLPTTRLTMHTRLETSPTINDRELETLEKEVDDIVSLKQNEHTSLVQSDERDEEEILREVEFNKRKQEMIRKIADTLYKTEYPYLEYLNHMTTECSSCTRVKDGCPLEKCKNKESMSLNDLRLHLIGDCNKIVMRCNVCDDTMRRPWVQYHDCRRTYREIISVNELKINNLHDVIRLKEKMIEDLDNEKKDDMERKMQHERVRQAL